MLNKIKIHSVILLMWILTNAEQCTTTDSCGTFNYNIGAIKATLTINGPIPSGRYSPIIQTIANIPNSVNIQGSLWHTMPTTKFGIQVESYDKCNGIPRYKSNCCITKTNNGCLVLNDEAVNQITVGYQTTFKCKVTIRAICLYDVSVSTDRKFDLYEGSFDIDPTSSISPPTNTTCNLFYKKMYDARYGDPEQLAQKVCVFAQ